MKQSMAMKILARNLLEGELILGNEIKIKVNQTLTQDSTGTMVYLQLEKLEIDEVKTDLSVAYIDHNMLQQDGWPGDGPDGRIAPKVPGEMAAKWTAFGWRVLEVDGHDMTAILEVLARAREGDGRPVAIISHTVKGKGVSYMEGRYYWHTRAIKPEEFAIAMRDLGEPEPAAEGAAR